MRRSPGQWLEPHKAPLRLLMYVVDGMGTFGAGRRDTDRLTETTQVPISNIPGISCF